MWKRYTKDLLFDDYRQCLILYCADGKYKEAFAVYSKSVSSFIIEDIHLNCYTIIPEYYYELPAHLCIDGMSADEHPDLIKDC